LLPAGPGSVRELLARLDELEDPAVCRPEPVSSPA
jgi:hypothetical protein